MAWKPGESGNPKGRPVGSVNRQLQMRRQAAELILPQVLAQALGGHFESQKLILELGMPKLRPVEVPVAFDLPEAGDTSPVRAVLKQAAAGELPMSSAKKIVHDLMPVVQKEEKALERKAHPPVIMNTYLRTLMDGE